MQQKKELTIQYAQTKGNEKRKKEKERTNWRMEMRISFEQKTEKISQFPCANIIFFSSPGYCRRRLRRIAVFKAHLPPNTPNCSVVQYPFVCRLFVESNTRSQTDRNSKIVAHKWSFEIERTKCVVANATQLENGTLCLRANANAFNIA